MRTLVAILFFLVCLPMVARAGEDERTRARQLADEGGTLYQDGRYAEALDKLDQAYALLKVPTVGYWSARSLEALGRWVAAADRYREVTHLEVPEVGAELHAKAQSEAREALAALEPRIPRLRIEVADADSLAIDGKTIPAPTEPLPLDPGTHAIVAMRGRQRVEKTVTLEEGRETRVALAFEQVLPPKPPAPPKKRTTVEPVEQSGGALRTGAYVALAAGGALLVAGAATGIALLVEHDRLDDGCIDGECSSRLDVDPYNALRPTTTIALSVGAAGVALGLILLFVPDSTNVSSGPGGIHVAF